MKKKVVLGDPQVLIFMALCGPTHLGVSGQGS